MLKICVILTFLMALAQSVNAAYLVWENGVEDWGSGVILGVNDLYVAPLDKAYDVNFVDGFDPLPAYGIDPTFQGEIYPNAGYISGQQLSSLHAYLDTLSNSNIDPRLINGINDRSIDIVQGIIGTLYQYNWVDQGQMLGNFLTIFLNSSDMALGGGHYNPTIFEDYHQNEDIVWAVFEESVIQQPGPIPEPSTIILFWGGLAGLACVGRRKK